MSSAAARSSGKKEATQCLRCHKCETGDSVVGPDLTHVASRKNREYILESIVFPDKQIAEGFEIAVLTLNDGNVVARPASPRTATRN